MTPYSNLYDMRMAVPGMYVRMGGSRISLPAGHQNGPSSITFFDEGFQAFHPDQTSAKSKNPSCQTPPLAMVHR